MSVIIEARRLNGTDLLKVIKIEGKAEGVINGIRHDLHETEKVTSKSKTLYGVLSQSVRVQIDDEIHTLRPSDKVTLAGRPSPKESGQ